MQTDTPDAVELRTRRDYTLTTRALKKRADELEKLAQKTKDEGYEREARTQLADSAAIRQFILPRFQEQAELPLVTPEQIRAGIAEALRDAVRGALVVRAPEDRQEDALASREEKLLERLATRIEAFAVELAGEAYSAGYAARENEPEVLANRCIHALSGGGY